jgi:hypothetical protein
MSWMNMMMNPKVHNLKKALFEILKERYAQNDNIIERVGASLVTDSDMKDFMTLVTSIYETAYMKCVNDHREQLKKAGLVANIVANNQFSKDG